MGIRVNYTQRGFQSKEEYEGFTGRTESNPYNPDRLVKSIVRCKNPACLISNAEDYTIEHVESRDLVANPIICGNCGGKNLQVDYFKPEVLPRIFSDENHKNAAMYEEVLTLWDNGKIHPSFSYIIDALKHPDYYYGVQSNAIYVDPNEPMMGGNVKDTDGNPLTWADYPWVDIKLISDPPLNTADPEVVVEPSGSIEGIPDQTFMDTYEYIINDSPTGEYFYRDLRIYYGPTGAIETTFGEGNSKIYKLYFPAGIWFDWERDINEDELSAIERWENESGEVHPRRADGGLIPAEDLYLYGGPDESDGITYAEWAATNARGRIKPSVGSIFPGADGVDLTLYNVSEKCDYINDDPDVYLEGVSPLLQTGEDIELPPIPLYVNGATGEGSPKVTDPITGDWISGYDYTATQIEKFKSDYPWLEITSISTREAGKYAQYTIKGANHMLRNRLIPEGENCNPGLSFNNDMYTCKMFITTQVDLDDPIY